MTLDWCNWACDLQKWQTLIAGLVGIGAAGFAYWLSRRRDQKLREEEAQSVAAALYGESIVMAGDIGQAARILIFAMEQEKLMNEDQLGLFVPVHPNIVNSLCDKLGLLSPTSVTLISLFYQQVDEVRRAISFAQKAHSIITIGLAAQKCVIALETARSLRRDLERVIQQSDLRSLLLEQQATHLKSRYEEADKKLKPDRAIDPSAYPTAVRFRFSRQSAWR